MVEKAKAAAKEKPLKKAKPVEAVAKPVKKVAKADSSMVKKVTAKAPVKRAPRTKKNAISAEQRAHYVEVAAYFIAERRGFAPGDTFADWVAAEVQVDQLIEDGKLGA